MDKAALDRLTPVYLRNSGSETAFQTRVIIVDPVLPADADLLPAAQLLRDGKVVAFPTETVYGLGANALDPDAVQAIFTAKGRPSDNPLIVHVADRTGLERIADYLPEKASILIDRFMPGPLTLVLPRSAVVPDIVTAGLDTVAIRIPEHPVARRLIELSGVPLAGPSANHSGRPSPTTAAHVLEDLDGIIPLIIDGGTCDFGLESTVLDVTGPVPIILRPGAVTAEEIMSVIGPVLMADPAQANAVTHRSGKKKSRHEQEANAVGQNSPSDPPRSPGMKYRHYAPRTPVLIAEGRDDDARTKRTLRLILKSIRNGHVPALFAATETVTQVSAGLPEGWRLADPNEGNSGISEMAGQAMTESTGVPKRLIFTIAHGPRGQARTAAGRLFAALRQLDDCHADVIIAESAESTGIGAAYVNRLRKAAGGGPEPTA